MANILENLGKMHIAVVVDKETKQGDLGEALAKLAVGAIMNGLGSAEWRKYMSIFADNADQLKVLSESTPGEASYLPRTRAYIVSNAVCAAGTNTRTSANVEPAIINAVANNAVDGTVTRPAEITALLPGEVAGLFQ